MNHRITERLASSRSILPAGSRPRRCPPCGRAPCTREAEYPAGPRAVVGPRTINKEGHMAQQVVAARVDRDRLRGQISDKYTDVALEPTKGFHFHTGRPLAMMLGYDSQDVDS